MKRKSKNEDGFAMIIVIVFASVLFILMSVALSGYFAWQKMNITLSEENSKTAEKIIIHPINEAD